MTDERPNELAPNGRVKKLIEDLETNQKKFIELKNFKTNGGVDNLYEFCLELRTDVHLATEKRILEIHNQRDGFLQSIDEYEAERRQIIGKYKFNKITSN
jgi:heme oxygenase